MPSELKSTTQGRTMVLTLCNPEHRNALGPEMYAAGVEALSVAESSAEVRPCAARGLALRAAREVGTNSMPSPRPTGINGRTVTTPASGMLGIPRTMSPSAEAPNPSSAGTCSP